MPANTEKRTFRFISAAAAALTLMASGAGAARAGGATPGPALLRAPVSCDDGTGNWACQIEAPAGFLAPVPVMVGNNSITPPSSPIRQLLQINIPRHCSQVAGTLFHESGEGCNLPISAGQLSLGANGIGTLSLTISIGTTSDEDNDLPCSALFGGQTSVTENFHVVLSQKKKEMLLAGMEDFISPAGPEGGEVAVPVSGHCVEQ